MWEYTSDHAQITAYMNMDKTAMQLYEPTTERCRADLAAGSEGSHEIRPSVWGGLKSFSDRRACTTFPFLYPQTSLASQTASSPPFFTN